MGQNLQGKLKKLSINPFYLIGTNILNFEYERGFVDGKLGVSFYYGRTGGATREILGIKSYTSEQTISLKTYSKSISSTSLWYGGQISVISGSIYVDNESAYGIGKLGLSGKVGYQFIIRSFYLDFYGGAGYAVTNDLFGSIVYNGDLTISKYILLFGIKTGIAF